jgi:hypothetical protein
MVEWWTGYQAWIRVELEGEEVSIGALGSIIESMEVIWTNEEETIGREYRPYIHKGRSDIQ